MRTRNGWIDDGKKITNSHCPNCKSKNFIETLSLESCPDCGLEFDYWGSGGNTVYCEMENRIIEQEKRQQFIEMQESFYGMRNEK